MKTRLLIVAMSLGTVYCALGQEPPQNRHGVGHGASYNEASEVYTARTPYYLEWTAEEFYTPLGCDPSVRYRDSGTWVMVYDAATRTLLASTPKGGFHGKVYVPVAGRHYVIVYALGAWNANIIEDMQLLKKAQQKGILGVATVIDDAAMANSPSGRKQAVERAARAEISQLPKSLTPNQTEERAAAIQLVASRSADAEDFASRISAYRKSMGWD
ncbi:MAG: hypothetical protein WCJ14_14510 [Verrucomicrobiota bacterium]